MKTVWTIAWREFRAYFLSPIAYVYLTVFLVTISWLFFRGFFLIGQADMRVFFETMPWLFLFLIPAVTMGKWAEERKLGTLEILFTLPVRDVQAVLGKFLAALMLLSAALLLTLPAAFTVAMTGQMDWGPTIGGYAGLLLMGGAYIAIGLAASALTESQIVAFIAGVAVCFLMLIIGTPFVVGGKGTLAAQLLQYAGLASHFASIGRGIIDTRDIIYYGSVIGFFLYLNLTFLRARR